MANKEIKYTIVAENNTKKAFTDVKKSSDEVEKNFSKNTSKMAKESKSFATQFADVFRKEIAGVGNEMGKVFKKQGNRFVFAERHKVTYDKAKKINKIKTEMNL